MKINGYRSSHRNRWQLLANRILSRDELLLWEFYIDQMDFDEKHEGFGTFTVNFKEIAHILGYSSETSVRTKHKKLLDLGFIHRTKNKKVFLMQSPKRYLHTFIKKGTGALAFAKVEKNQPVEVFFQTIATNLQLIGKNSPNLLKKSDSQYLDSFKVASNIEKDISFSEPASNSPYLSSSDVESINNDVLDALG